MKTFIRLMTAFVLALLLATCSNMLVDLHKAGPLDSAKATLELTLAGTDSLTAVTGDLTLPTTASGGITITWSSDTPNVIGNDGKVTRPATGAGDKTVVLTATLTDGTTSVTKTFSITVKETGSGGGGSATFADAVTSAKALSAYDYTTATWSSLVTAWALPESTDAEKATKKSAIDTAIAGLVEDSATNQLAKASTVAGVYSGSYTAGSYAAITTAKAMAETTDADKKAKAKALYAAVKALVPASQTAAAFSQFSLLGMDDSEWGGAGSAGSITRKVLPGTDVSAVVLQFVLIGSKATLNGVEVVSGLTKFDFSSSQTLVITAADGTTTANWVISVTPTAPTFSKLAMDATRTKWLGNPTGSTKVMRSIDSGAHWTMLTSAPKPAGSLAGIQSNADGTTFVMVFWAISGYSNSLYVSTDSGATWSLADGTTHDYQGMFLAMGTTGIFVDMEAAISADIGFRYSGDKGATWTSTSTIGSTAYDTTGYSASSQNGGQILVISNSNYSLYTAPGTFASAPTEITWNTVTGGGTYNYSASQNIPSAVISNDGTKILAVYVDGSGSPFRKVAYCSNSGASFTVTADVSSTLTYSPSFLAGSSDLSVVYAATNYGSGGRVLTSSNQGTTWTSLANSPNGMCAGLWTNSDGTKVFAQMHSNTPSPAGTDSLWSSADSGATWTQVY